MQHDAANSSLSAHNTSPPSLHLESHRVSLRRLVPRACFSTQLNSKDRASNSIRDILTLWHLPCRLGFKKPISHTPILSRKACALPPSKYPHPSPLFRSLLLPSLYPPHAIHDNPSLSPKPLVVSQWGTRHSQPPFQGRYIHMYMLGHTLPID